MEKYTAQDLRKMQLGDETTAQIIRWLDDGHKPSQAEWAQARPAIKYCWLIQRQLVVLSGVDYYQRAEQQALLWQSRWMDPGGSITVAENHTGTLS